MPLYKAKPALSKNNINGIDLIAQDPGGQIKKKPLLSDGLVVTASYVCCKKW